jgi:hypothetical protein
LVKTFVEALLEKYSEFEKPEPLDLVDSHNQHVPIEIIGSEGLLKR